MQWFAKGGAEPFAHWDAETFFGLWRARANDVGEGGAEELFAGRMVGEKLGVGKGVGEGDHVVIEKWGADFQSHSHGGGVDFPEYVVREIVLLVAEHGSAHV